MFLNKQAKMFFIAGSLIVSIFSIRTVAALEYYISPNGNDANSGTLEAPFLTLEKARDSIRALSKLPAEGVQVNIVEGRYARTHSFELTSEDSGTATAPIVYKSYQGAQVIFDGGILVPNALVQPILDPDIRGRLPKPNKIIEIDLAGLKITDFGKLGPTGFPHPYKPAQTELTIDGVVQHISRYPNKGNISMGTIIDAGSNPRQNDFSNRGATFAYADNLPTLEQKVYNKPRINNTLAERVALWTKAKDIWITGIFNKGWADDTLKVKNIDIDAGTLSTESPHLYSFEKNSFSHWIALNLLEEIDISGEYFIDKEKQKLYFYPPYDLKNSIIQLSIMTEPMVVMENVSHVSFDHLIFENTRGTAFYIEGGDSNSIVASTLRNLGLVGVQIGKGSTPVAVGPAPVAHAKPLSRLLGSYDISGYRYNNPAWNREGGTNNGINGCNIYNTGAGGVILGGGDRKSLTPAGNYVINSNIHHVNRWTKAYRSNINVDGVGNIIANNHLHKAKGQAVLLYGNDHIVEYNEIDHVLTDISDMGAIYLGRDQSEQGNVFRYNFFHHIGNSHEGGDPNNAIFIDDGGIYNSIFGNVVYKVQGGEAAFRWNLGGLTSVANNLIIQSGNVTRYNKYKSYERMHNTLPDKNRITLDVDIRQDPYKTAYPYLYESYTKNYNPGKTEYNNHIFSDDLSDFIDAQHLNFSLNENAKIMNTAANNVTDDVRRIFNETVHYQNINFKRIGLQISSTRSEQSSPNFTLLTPAYNEITSTVNPSLGWQASFGADKYRVLIATDEDFSHIIVDTNTVENSYRVETPLLPNKIYYWKVAAIVDQSRSSQGKKWSNEVFKFVVNNKWGSYTHDGDSGIN